MSIDVRHLSLAIGETHICSDLNISFKPGEFWGILGVNGVGKSTLLHTLIDIDAGHATQISIDNVLLSKYKNQRKKLAIKTGLLLQEYEYNFPCSVLEAALIGRHPHLSNWQWESDIDINLASQALAQTNLMHLKDRNIISLSGGEKRRLNIATLLTQNPDYYLLDEPTNHLDLKAQIQILKMLKHIFSSTQKAGIMVLHDPNLAYQYCDNILLLFGNGKWASGKTREMITVENLSHVYDCEFEAIHNNHNQYFIPLHI